MVSAGDTVFLKEGTGRKGKVLQAMDDNLLLVLWEGDSFPFSYKNDALTTAEPFTQDFLKRTYSID